MSNPDLKFQALVKMESVVTSAVKLLHENRISYPILQEHVILIVDETNMSVDTIEVILGQNSQAKKLEMVTQEDKEKQLSAVQDVFIRKVRCSILYCSTYVMSVSLTAPKSIDFFSTRFPVTVQFSELSDTTASCPPLLRGCQNNLGHASLFEDRAYLSTARS